MRSRREVIKGGMEGKRKIIGTTIAVVLVASVALMVIPAGIARDPENGNIQSGDTLFCGESRLSFNTADLPNVVRLEGRLGDAEGEVIKISNPGTCNEMDIESVKYKFILREEELSIDVKEDVVNRGEDIIVNVCGNPETYYYLIITNVIEEEEPPSIDFAGDVVDLPDAGEPGAENVSVDIETMVYTTISWHRG